MQLVSIHPAILNACVQLALLEMGKDQKDAHVWLFHHTKLISIYLLILIILESCTNNSCDPLTTCFHEEGSEFNCTSCPSGYNGTGMSGCYGIIPFLPFLIFIKIPSSSFSHKSKMSMSVKLHCHHATWIKCASILLANLNVIARKGLQ